MREREPRHDESMRGARNIARRRRAGTASARDSTSSRRRLCSSASRALWEIGQRGYGVDLQLLPARFDQLGERGKRGVTPIVLVGRHHGLRRAGPRREFGLGEAAPAPNGSDQLGRSHVESISLCLCTPANEPTSTQEGSHRNFGSMQFSPELRDGVASGRITLSFRLWQRPKVKVGGQYAVGAVCIEIDSIEMVPFSSVTPADGVGRVRGIANHCEHARGALGADQRRHARVPHRVPPRSWKVAAARGARRLRARQRRK